MRRLQTAPAGLQGEAAAAQAAVTLGFVRVLRTLVTEIAEYAMLCGAASVSIALADGTADGSARLTIEAGGGKLINIVLRDPPPG